MKIVNPINELKETEFVWRWGRNLRRTARYHWTSSDLPELARTLREEGIASTPSDDLFEASTLEAVEEVRDTYEPRAEKILDEVEGKEPDPDDRKPFLRRLFDDPLDPGNPLMTLALDQNVLDVVNAYMGMYSLLRAVEVWLTFPTPGNPVETQLWHEDGDDLQNVKLFLYLSDVEEENGPFTYIPRTHPLGDRDVRPRTTEDGRVTDNSMEEEVARDEWRICEAPSGTAVFADTCGWHKALEPTEGHRLLVALQYTSGTPRYPRSLEITDSPSDDLTPAQRHALAL